MAIVAHTATPDKTDKVELEFWEINGDSGENLRMKVQVGSRTGAVIRRWIPFPAPASSNAACGFPALRFPDGFASSLI